MPKIVITRKNEFINKLKYFEVLVNDKKLGSIKNGSSEEFDVAAGQQQIECKVNWYYSNNYLVDAQEGKTIYLQVKNNNRYLIFGLFAVIISFLVARIFQLKGIITFETMYNIRIVYAVLLVLYLIYTFTIGRKKYLWLGLDESNPFAN